MALGLIALAGCSAITSTTNTTADAAHTVAHGVSVSSRGTTNSAADEPADTPGAQARAYLQSQMPQIRREAARGRGEHIDALARLMSDDAAPVDSANLGAWMQAHYDTLFAGHTSAQRLMNDIRARRS